jgi:molecular chaperone GrpE
MVDKKDKKEKEVKIDKKNKREEELRKQLDQAQAEIDKWKNKYYMAYADMENARKLNDKNYSEALKYRASGFVDQLIPILDAFSIALDMKVSDEKVKQYLIGFDHIYKQIIEMLKAEGVTNIIPSIDDDFDYKTMHAMDTIIDEGPPNKVKKVYAKGYKLKDRIIRAAMVSVSKQPETPSKESEKQEDVNQTNEEKTSVGQDA